MSDCELYNDISEKEFIKEKFSRKIICVCVRCSRSNKGPVKRSLINVI